MNELILHLFAPTRFDRVGAIVGDTASLHRLRDAITDAIESGTGGAYLVQSDGTGYCLAILAAHDMARVCPPCAAEAVTQRATRQTVGMRALPGFLEAIQKSRPPLLTTLAIPRFTHPRLGHDRD
ncbi:MAG: hypothetical protein H7232_13935 [Aeromicrobium sp.]|nr:hypothetical protein [Burkholderiales bacterium]